MPGFGLVKHVRTGGLIAKRWPAVGGVLLVTAAVGLLWWSPWEARERPEPVYDGRPLTYWLNPPPDFRDGYWPNIAQQFLAASASIKADSNAVPFLVKAMQQDSWFGARVYRKQVWPNLPGRIKEHLPPPRVGNPWRIRDSAASKLVDMGPMAKPAIPALIRAWKADDSLDVRLTAGCVLANVGKGDSRVVEVVSAALKDKDVHIRRFAAAVLGDTGQGNRSAIAALTGALKDKDGDVQIAAVAALARIGNGNRNVVIALTETLNGGDSKVQIQAALALCDIGEGKSSSNVIIALRRALKDFNPEVRWLSARSLGVIGQGDQAAIAGLTQALNDAVGTVRESATNALLKLGPEAAAKAGLKKPPLPP